jgi:flavin reductase (DIM6/NTAB) family NADH-FMN oxidoreductase RutF
MKRSLPLSQVYRQLEPGPVVMVTTARAGRPNVMPMSWHTMIDFEPPLVGFVLSNRNHTFNTLLATKECAINIPTVELLAKAVQGEVGRTRLPAPVACHRTADRNLPRILS